MNLPLWLRGAEPTLTRRHVAKHWTRSRRSPQTHDLSSGSGSNPLPTLSTSWVARWAGRTPGRRSGQSYPSPLTAARSFPPFKVR